MVLGKLQVPGRPTIWTIVWQGTIALAVGAGMCVCVCGGGGGFGHFYSRLSFLFSFFLSARYSIKYCLKGPLVPKQPLPRK